MVAIVGNFICNFVLFYSATNILGAVSGWFSIDYNISVVGYRPGLDSGYGLVFVTLPLIAAGVVLLLAKREDKKTHTVIQ